MRELVFYQSWTLLLPSLAVSNVRMENFHIALQEAEVMKVSSVIQWLAATIQSIEKTAPTVLQELKAVLPVC